MTWMRLNPNKAMRFDWVFDPSTRGRTLRLRVGGEVVSRCTIQYKGPEIGSEIHVLHTDKGEGKGYATILLTIACSWALETFGEPVRIPVNNTERTLFSRAGFEPEAS